MRGSGYSSNADVALTTDHPDVVIQASVRHLGLSEKWRADMHPAGGIEAHDFRGICAA